jgi:hypothetical protein
VLQPLTLDINVDLRVLAFAAAATMLSALLAGVSPALAGARAVAIPGRGATRRLSAQKLILVVQVATGALLLVETALLGETLQRMRLLDPGFDADSIATFTLDPGMKGYDADRALVLSRQMLERVRSLPSVAAAGLADRALMRGTGRKASVSRAGTPVARDDFLNCSTNAVGPGYFETMGMRVTAGRDFLPGDRNEHRPRHVVVNQAFVRRFFPHQDPIVARVGIAAPGTVAAPDLEIIGVASDAKYRSLREEIHPTVYSLMDGGFEYGFTLYVRTRDRPESVIGTGDGNPPLAGPGASFR